MSEAVTPTPVYFHNCRMLGPQTRVPRALLADGNGEYILCYQYKCPMCSYTVGEPELAEGVTLNPNGRGYLVDTTVAVKLR